MQKEIKIMIKISLYKKKSRTTNSLKVLKNRLITFKRTT